MSTKEIIDELIRLLSDGPVLPGGVKEHHNVCGKKNCRCKDPENPVVHGPYTVLSWTVSGQGSSLTLDPGNRTSAEEMVERFRTLKDLVNQLALGYVDGIRARGMAEIRRDVLVLGGSRMMLKVSTAEAKRLVVSRDAWKDKALQRQCLLEKDRITMRDLKKSRDTWRAEAMTSRTQRAELESKFASTRVRIDCLTNEVEHLQRCVKKNG
jgi:hypothetical protein